MGLWGIAESTTTPPLPQKVRKIHNVDGFPLLGPKRRLIPSLRTAGMIITVWVFGRVGVLDHFAGGCWDEPSDETGPGKFFPLLMNT